MSEFSEDLMLQCLEQNPPDLSTLAAPLTVLHEDDPETADAHSRLIRETLKEKNALRQVVDLYLVLADWHATDRPWRNVALKQLKEAFSEDPLYQLYLELSSLDTPRVRVKEALRRISVMADFAPGGFVYEKNRGFGTIREVHHDQRKVVIDFLSQSGQDMELGFASEILDLIDDQHLFARKHMDPESLDQLVKDKPAEVVRIALRSFGPTPAGRLQDILSPAIVPDSKWKTFWANARKELKNDTLVVIPVKRSEPIELLTKEKSYDEAWFRDLSDLRHMETILLQLEELLDAGAKEAVTGPSREKVIDRLRFVVTGAEGKHHDFSVRVWLIARELGMTPGEVNLTGFLGRVKTPEGMLGVVDTLPAKMTKEFFAALSDVDQEATSDVLLRVLSQFEYSALNEAINLLFSLGHEERVAATLRQGWNQWDAEVDVMYWLSQNRDKVALWNYGNTPDLVARLLKVLNRDYAGNRLRVQNQLREIFRQPSWLKEVLGSMDERQRRAFTQGVKDNSAWEQLDKASVLGQIVKIDGSVSDIVSGRTEETEETAQAGLPRVTSFRSYKEREAYLEKLNTKDIPENTREIAVARSYGDLRENFEYKAAKDTQRLLLSRKAEIESQLREVKATDFTEFPTDVAGIATTVTIAYGDGRQVAYHILGEWDSDTTRNILSSGSALAKALSGCVAGDTVSIPGDQNREDVQVVSVTPLADDIRTWLAEALPTPDA